MAIIAKPTDFTATTTILSSEVNDNFDTIYNEFNGNIAAANLATDSVTTAKIADDAVTTDKIVDDAVTTAKIVDDNVTADKIDWASTGAGGGIWWEEIARVTHAGSSATMTFSSLPQRNFNKLIVFNKGTDTATLVLQFNGDTGSNYAYKRQVDDSAEANNTNDTDIDIGANVPGPQHIQVEFLNAGGNEALVTGKGSYANTAGEGTVPRRTRVTGKWDNSSTITSVVLTRGANFTAGSIGVILGHN